MLLSNSLFIDTEYKDDCEHKLNYLENINLSSNESTEKPNKKIANSKYKIIENASESAENNNNE